MKLRLVNVLLASCLPCMVWAQSSVSVYGAVDLFMGHATSNTQSVTKMLSGGLESSRLGFRAVEDLGGGWKARVTLEGRIGADEGSFSSGFNRYSTVALAGPYGTMSMGLQPGPYFMTAYSADPFGWGDYFSPMVVIAGNDAQPRLQPLVGRPAKMLLYRTPDLWGGLTAGLGVAPAGATNSSGTIWGANIGWNSADGGIGYAIQKQKSGTAAAPVDSPISSTFHVLAAKYRVVKPLLVTAAYQYSQSSLATTPSGRVFSVGAVYDVTANSQVKFSAARRKVQETSRGQLVWALGYDYWLSKRTAVYGRFLHQSNFAGAKGAFPGVPMTDLDTSGANYGVGIRHSF